MGNLLEDCKIYLSNTAVFISLFSNMDAGLKTLLVMATLGYTITRWYYLVKNKGK